MFNFDQFDFCSEFCVVVKTIEFEMTVGEGSKRLRLEALRSRNENCIYSVASYEQVERGGDIIWARYDLPWVCENSEDDALSCALRLLGQRRG